MLAVSLLGYAPPLQHQLLADTIVDPDQPLALRLSGQLLLGVVKIYSKKVNYLFEDCSSAIIKIQEVLTTRPCPGPMLCCYRAVRLLSGLGP